MGKLGKPKQHVPVFVGSTYEDLKEYRTAVCDALHHLETIVRGMEYFGSKPGSPKEECLKAVQSCKAYIGIFGMRYGSIDEESGKSMTHLEYEEASRLGLPILIYLIDEQKQPILPKYVETGDKAKLLQGLKTELKKKYTVSFFTTPEDLAKRVAQDLPPILEQIGVAIEPERESHGAVSRKSSKPARQDKADRSPLQVREFIAPLAAKIVLLIRQACEDSRISVGELLHGDSDVQGFETDEADALALKFHLVYSAERIESDDVSIVSGMLHVFGATLASLPRKSVSKTHIHHIDFNSPKIGDGRVWLRVANELGAQGPLPMDDPPAWILERE